MRAVIMAVLALALLAGPAHADPPEVSSTEVGEHDAGWMRVKCTGPYDRQRCVLRVPKGFRSMTTTYLYAGEVEATETTTPYPPHHVGTQPRFTRRITTGIKVSCASDSGHIDCTVRVRRGVDRFIVLTISAGIDYGGIDWSRL